MFLKLHVYGFHVLTVKVWEITLISPCIEWSLFASAGVRVISVSVGLLCLWTKKELFERTRLFHRLL